MVHNDGRSGLERRKRSRSPTRTDREHHSHKRRRSPVYDKPLPFSARLLDKHDFDTYRVLFASYLDIQKQIVLDEIDQIEAKGRWKSFIKKWNNGELAEGWYDPIRLKQDTLYGSSKSNPPGLNTGHSAVPRSSVIHKRQQKEEDDDDEDYGPAPALSNGSSSRAGPSIPTMDDLALRRENDREERESAAALAKARRRADAKLEKQRIDDLAPRAEPGTRERQLEKKREVAASNKSFAESKSGGASGIAEVSETDLMGGGDDDSLEGIKRRKREEERKLTERELRREEFARARREEMDQRKKVFTEKEEERTKRFIELAKRRFG